MKDPDRIYRVQAQDTGLRLDLFLASAEASISRSRFKAWIEEGLVLVNGRRVKPRYLLRDGDEIALWLPEPEEPDTLIPEPMPLRILHEDEDLVVVDKPAGLVVHPGAGHSTGTLVHGLLAHCSTLASQGAPLRPGIVHRLDQDTSGVLVVAKTDSAYLRLIDQFKERHIQKTYLTLVFGTFPESSGEIATLIGRHPKDRKRMAVVERNGKTAVTQWRMVKSWHGAVSLLEVQILTGRTHQIRVHCRHLGHPVVGDETYGGGRKRMRQVRHQKTREILAASVRRPLLHARTLRLEHPRTGRPMTFEAPLPSDFRSVLDALDRIQPHRPPSSP